jgi:hypothetical protein
MRSERSKSRMAVSLMCGGPGRRRENRPNGMGREKFSLRFSIDLK